MSLRTVAITLALAGCASAEHRLLLPATVASIVCEMEDTVPSLLSTQFLFSVDRLKEPTSEHSGDDITDEDHERHADLASLIVAHPEMLEVFWGFESGVMEEWTQADEEKIPDEYEGQTDLSAHRLVLTNDDQHLEEYYADHLFHRIDPPYETGTEEYPTTERPWYQAAMAEDVGAWTKPYLSFSGEHVLISPTVKLMDAAGEAVGVVAFDFKPSALEERLHEAAELGPEGTVMFISDSSDEHLLISASEPDMSYDAEGNQLSALDSSNEVISGASQAIMDHVASGGDPTKMFVTTAPNGEKWYVEVITIDHIGGLPFEDGDSWSFVLTLPAECHEGQVLDEELAECVCE